MTTDLTAAKAALTALAGAPLLCAVSGGLDSMCLVHLAKSLGLTVTAAHFNHRLRGEEADRDEAFVRDWCAKRGVPFVRGEADVRACAAETGETVEEAARHLRYAFLAEQQRELGCTWILTAHHADDSAETMLLNLIRGTGLRGLAGIPEVRGSILRPLRAHTRAELAEYAKEHDISYVEDSTNLDPDGAARNLLRLNVLPFLKELNPRAVENMARTAELLAADEAALTRETETLLSRCRLTPGRAELPLECLTAEPAVRNRCVLAAMAAVSGRRKDLIAAHVAAALALSVGKTVSLPYGMGAVRQERVLVIEKTGGSPAETTIRPGETVRFGPWRVTLTADGPGRALRLPPDGVCAVTAWDRNDRMTLPESRGERSLKRLCADRGIAPAERDRLPVLRIGGRAAAVPGIGVDTTWLPREHEGHIFVNFEIEERT